MTQEDALNKNFLGTRSGGNFLNKYLKINPWTRIPTEIIEKILEEKKAKEGFDYVPRGPLKPVQGEGGSGKEYDPVRLPNIVVRPSRLTLPLQLPFSPDFIVRPSSPVLTAKKGSRLVSKHQSGGWISWLGQEGVPTLRSLRGQGSYNNPIQLPEITVVGTAPKLTNHKEFVIQSREYPGVPAIVEGTREYQMYGKHRLHPDLLPYSSFRMIYQMPSHDDTAYFDTEGPWNAPANLGRDKKYQQKAKQKFMKDASKTRGDNKKSEAARRRGAKGK